MNTIDIKAFSDDAGKNQRKFINQVNSQFLLDKDVNKYAESLSIKEAEIEAMNNPASIAYDTDISTLDKNKYDRAILVEIATHAWWKLAHKINTDKARSLPRDLKYIINGIELSRLGDVYFINNNK